MDPLLPFRIPVKGLHAGLHVFTFRIDREFFAAFEFSPIEEGVIDLTVGFDKRADMVVMSFDFQGSVRTECDRCLAAIDLPLEDSQHLVLKYSVEEKESEDPDLVYIHPETSSVNIAPYVYDFVLLAMPLVKVIDCESMDVKPCDEQMLAYLREQAAGEPAADEEDDRPLKDLFKDWNNNQ
jgi:uncharacterized metal-binding protein YceD (DUF177 family)